ncbi:DUF1697 domain-containing protein [Lysobacter korlensis]|uniref:DUF1697 domain-containing protein n=1 Tax=Lysobacter korlensis TaxID=553636 RepID=A0ABV6RY13_9GAMM
MTRWIALLRGVNVGGITVRSADLRDLFRELGFANVSTVLASGNVLFDSEDAADDLKPRIERALGERFRYDAWIVLIDRATLERIAAAFPFERADEQFTPYVVFGSDPALLRDLADAAGVPDPAVESVVLGDGALYWRVVKGRTIDSPVGKLLAKGKYRTTTTNRNLRTVEKLLAA